MPAAPLSSESLPAFSTIGLDDGEQVVYSIVYSSASGRLIEEMGGFVTGFESDATTITISRTPTSSPITTSSSLQAPPLPASSTSLLSTTRSTSPTSLPGGLIASAKIGISLGVPLGVIVLAVVAFLGYLYGKRRGNKNSTARVADEQFRGFPGDKDSSATRGQDGAGAVGPLESDNNGGLPRYAEELQGTPGVKRHELPARREATGYFTPNVVTS